MTSPLDSYARSLDTLQFSDEVKDRLTDALRAAATRMEAANDDGAATERAFAPGTTHRPARRAARRHRRWARVAAALALALALGGGGTAAVAVGILPNPANVLSDIFGGAPAQTELLNDVGRPVGASVTSNGVTVTAEAVIGDRSNYTVVYSLTFSDPAVLEGIQPNEQGTLPLVADATHHVDGAMSGGGGAWFFDNDPTDGTIQYAESMGFTTWNGEGIVGRTMRFSLQSVRFIPDTGEMRTIASGDWNLKFEMNYVDTTVDLDAGQHTTWQDSAVTVDAVAVSSVGITVDYTIDRQMGDLGASGRLSDEAQEEQDAVIGLPVTVHFADGTTFDAANANSTAQKQDDATSTVTKLATYERIVNVRDITSVTVGDVDIPVDAA